MQNGGIVLYTSVCLSKHFVNKMLSNYALNYFIFLFHKDNHIEKIP